MDEECYEGVYDGAVIEEWSNKAVLKECMRVVMRVVIEEWFIRMYLEVECGGNPRILDRMIILVMSKEHFNVMAYFTLKWNLIYTTKTCAP